MATSEPPRVALCVARFYSDLADRLVSGTRAALEEAGVAEIEEFDVAQFFDEFSHKWHGCLGLGHIDRLDHAGTRKLRPKLSQQIRAPRYDADAIAIE